MTISVGIDFLIGILNPERCPALVYKWKFGLINGRPKAPSTIIYLVQIAFSNQQVVILQQSKLI